MNRPLVAFMLLVALVVAGVSVSVFGLDGLGHLADSSTAAIINAWPKKIGLGA